MTPLEFRREFTATMEATRASNETFTVMTIFALAMGMIVTYGYKQWSLLLIVPAVLAILVVWRYKTINKVLPERTAAAMLRKYGDRELWGAFDPAAFEIALEASTGYVACRNAEERMEYRMIMARLVTRHLLGIDIELPSEQRKFLGWYQSAAGSP